VDLTFLDIRHIISHEDGGNYEKRENNLKLGPPVYDVGTLSSSSRRSVKPPLPSVVSMATRCGLDGPEIESQWGRDFPHPSRPALQSTQPPIKRVPDLFTRNKAAGGT
jgi:hypothetical protein